MRPANKIPISRQLPFLLLIMGVTSAAIAYAVPGGPDSLNVLGSQRGNESQDSVSIQAQAGNVTEVNINANSITKAWQGYYGNITGNIILTDASGDTFYNWSGLGSISGEVYASRNDSIDWTSINCTNSTEISNENAFVSKDATAPDSITNTFNQVNHPLFQVGSLTLPANTCNSTNAHNNTGQSTTNFYQVLLADGAGDLVYTTLIDENQVGFNGGEYDFELLVAENGNVTEASTSTTYYFYIELS